MKTNSHRPNRKSKKQRSVKDVENDAARLIEYIDRAPDWITDVLIDALTEASQLTGFPDPTWAPEETNAQRLKTMSDLLGQAMLRDVDLRDSKYRVRRALYELLHNPDTPAGLYEACGEFVTEQSNVDAENLFHSDEVLGLILKSVPSEDLRGAVIAGNEVTP